jgi:predicted NBD/HSP70 family sugar kinase
VLNGQLYEGAHGGAGEIDDVPFRRLVRSATPVSPALDGLVGLAAALAPQHAGSTLAPPYTPDAVFDAFDRADPLAVAVVDRLAEWAAWFAAALTAVVDPEAIVLAGSIGAREPLARRVAEHLDRFAPTAPRLVVSALGDGSVLAGAVALASAQALVRRLDERRRPA